MTKRMGKAPTELTVIRNPATGRSNQPLLKESRDTANFARPLVCPKQSTAITLQNAVTRRKCIRRNSLVISLAALAEYVITSVRLANKRSVQASTRKWHANFVLVAKAAAAEAAVRAEVPRTVVIPVHFPTKVTLVID